MYKYNLNSFEFNNNLYLTLKNVIFGNTYPNTQIYYQINATIDIRK